jgi:hypothetical protein
MKKNAIAIASIMFVAGCATNGRYSTAQTDSTYGRDPSLSAQYDPATGGSQGAVSGTDSSDAHRNYTSVNDYHADSSIRGGSNDARGWQRPGGLSTEDAPHPLNPAVQADSSIRGGSMQARQSDWYSNGPFEPTTPRDNRIKADSSIRGGSNQARYPQYQSSADVNSADQSMDHPEGYVEYLAIIPEDSNSTASNDLPDKQDSVLGSANWNASDDLLQDGTVTQPSAVSNSNANNDASVGGAATSESGSASSTSSHDDISSPNADIPASGRETSDSGSLSSPGSKKDLNSSSNLERDISGDYKIGQQRDAGVSDITSSQSQANVSVSPSTHSSSSGASETAVSQSSSAPSGSTDVQNSTTSTAVGGPGSTETGSASSSSTYDSSTPVLPSDPSRDSYSLFRNNRAQGVGSAATGELGIANGEQVPLADDQLAAQVKSMIMRETTGTEGITAREFARQVQVTSHNGDITLKGTVPSQKAKDSLEIRAREIAGVHRVDNQLTVGAQAESPISDLNSGRDLEDTTSQLHGLDHIRE